MEKIDIIKFFKIEPFSGLKRYMFMLSSIHNTLASILFIIDLKICTV